MSGSGGAKKKPAKTQGWEEAGSEFYQESYPAADNDLDIVFQKDPQHLTTLLPSKQTRAVAATTIRMRTNRSVNDKTFRRQQTTTRSRKDATIHRTANAAVAAQTQDVQVSMLPDLSENISNEQTIWEEIMQIKTMPILMSQKKELKSKILNQPNLRLQGFEEFKWKRRKLWKKFSMKMGESYKKLGIWSGDLKKIEGYFGTGVMSFFSFIKWLLFLDIFILTIMFSFVTLPHLINNNFENSDMNDTCSNTSQISNNAASIILDLVQGTGFLECTYLFYGYYPDAILEFHFGDTILFYDFPLSYIVVTFFCLFVSLAAIVKKGMKGFKERLIEGEDQYYLHCNLVFSGWDFCIQNSKSARDKHLAIFNELKANVLSEKLKEERQSQTRNEKIKLVFIRIVINSLILGIAIFCGCSVFFASSLVIVDVHDVYLNLFYEFSPFILIVSLNLLVPKIFNLLIKFEKYTTPVFVSNMILFRSVFFRMALLAVLYVSFYVKIIQDDNSTVCWETFVGRQIFKLLLTDFTTNFLVALFINFPRGLLLRHFENRPVCAWIGAQNFDVFEHALDVVYAQTLIWFGSFYAPLMSICGALYLFLIFYLKKFACLVNSKPVGTIHRFSRSSSVFMVLLLVAFVAALVPLIFSVSALKPSGGCGPFQNVPYAWFTVEKLFEESPTWFGNLVAFSSTPSFNLPLIFVLLLFLFYYKVVNSANRNMVAVLKNQLVLEGHDKQFLLERLSMFIKQQQENQKRLRRIEMAQEVERNRAST